MTSSYFSKQSSGFLQGFSVWNGVYLKNLSYKYVIYIVTVAPEIFKALE